VPPRNSKFMDQEGVATQQVGRAGLEPAKETHSSAAPAAAAPGTPVLARPALAGAACHPGADPPPPAPQAGLSGQQLKKVDRPATQGVYNPITNAWVVPPANKRILQGLSFSPASLFKAPRAQAGLLGAGTGGSR
jgi:hypothetical protein